MNMDQLKQRLIRLWSSMQQTVIDEGYLAEILKQLWVIPD